jgi:hypothetical protein
VNRKDKNRDGVVHISRPSSEGAETGGKENADISYVNREMKRMQSIIDDPAGSHETRIYRPANNTAQRVPCGGVKPVPEFLGKMSTNGTQIHPPVIRT